MSTETTPWASRVHSGSVRGAVMPPRVCALLGVVDSDALRIEWDGAPRVVRLIDVLPERAASGGLRPATDFGRQTLRWLRDVVLKDTSEIEIEFTHAEQPLSNSGRLLAHASARGESINVRMIREGFSPCFIKYGYPLLHREAMERAELWARYEGLGVWGGAGGIHDYASLRSAWLVRAGQIEGYRHQTELCEDIFDARSHYPEITDRAQRGLSGHLFGDLVRSFRLSDGAVLIQIGNPFQPLTAFFPSDAAALAGFVEREFLGFGKPNYVYLSGRLSTSGDQPQMVIERLEQLSTRPPRTAT